MMTSRANATRDSIEFESDAQMLQAARAAQGPARRRHDRDRLVGHHRGEGRARGPVERVFQDAGNAVVELRGAQHEPVAFGDRRKQFLDRRGPLLALEILVVERDRREVPDRDLGAAGEFLAQRLQHRIRIGAAAQAAGHSNQADRCGFCISRSCRGWGAPHSESRSPMPTFSRRMPAIGMIRIAPGCWN